MERKLFERYQYIFEEELLNEINAVGQYRKIEKDFPMMDIGNEINYMPLVLDGAIRVMGDDGKNNELLLYYLEVGDTCAMTMACCMGGRKSNIRAITERETQLIMIPIRKMEEWLIKYRSWRAFVFDSYDSRMKEILGAIDALAFHNLEERLYKYLREKAMVLHTPSLDITHYQIANDLNTSRVVISRLMKKLVLDQKIETNRFHVKVLEFLPKE